jgi:hypothetical protein
MFINLILWSGPLWSETTAAGEQVLSAPRFVFVVLRVDGLSASNTTTDIGQAARVW